MVAAVSKTGLDALELRLQRLDAKVKVSPGQLGLDFSAPAASPPRAAAKSGGGEKCGGGWIDPKKTCRKGEGSQAGQSQQEEGQAKPYRPTPQVNEPLTVKPMVSGDIEYDVTAERVKNKGASKFWRSVRNGRPAYFHYFRDRKAVEHWMAEDNAQADADAEVGSNKRRSKEWQAEFRQSYSDHRRMYADTSDYDLLESADRWVSAGKATRGGTMIDVRIGGNKHSRPIRAGFFDPKEKTGGEVEPAAAEPVLTNPSRIDPGLAPKAKQPGINAQDVTTTAQQAQLARQQRQAAAAAGDQSGAKAWQEAERRAERDRLQMAMNRGQQQQSSLFGVTEYDESMPLFQRRDSVDPVAQLVGKILRDQLPGAEVLDWSRQPRGITAGRAVSEGLVYRFRCDSDTIGYQPAWDGIDERQWELRSEGFLMARDPSMRLDYRRGGGVKFQQAKTKRQCSKGYGCGSACIAMNKECRVQPSSAISKVRLKQLQALAQEGDAKAAAQAQELQMQRDAKAQGLQQGRQTAKLQKLLEDPRVVEMVRTGKIPEAGAAGGEPMAGQVRNVKPSEVEVDPERFQYKIGSSATGEVGSLSGVQRWDPNLAGVVSVWQDPADGKTYVVNGHNRLALSRRLGAEEVTVRYLKAKDAQEARAIGAMQNIAEGAGTEIDAGKFFRDSGVKTIEEVKAKGLPLNSGKAERGLALAQLPDEMFQDVVQGNLKVRRAAVIGASGLDQDKQREVYKMLKARPSMTDETLAEYVEHLAVSTRQSQTEIDLFGANETSVDTGLARAELANGLKKALGREARLLGAVSKTQQAKELLEQKGGNVINVEQSQQQANEASSVLRTFDQLKNLSGPIRSALDQAAARVTAGENRNKVARELREAVVQAMEEELRNAGLKPDQPPRDELTMNLFDSADRFDALECRLVALSDRMDRRCQAPDGSFYGTSGQCRKGKETGSVRHIGKTMAATVVQKVKRLARRLGIGSEQAVQRSSNGDTDAAMASAQRILAERNSRQQKEKEAAERKKQREQELLSRGPQKWGVKSVENNEDKNGNAIVWHESRYEVQLEEPLRLPATQGKGDRLVDKLSFGVFLQDANAKPITRKLRDQGIDVGQDSVDNAVELAWLTGAGGNEAKLGGDRIQLPGDVARRFSSEISKQVKGLVSRMEEGQLVLCTAHEEDGYGDKRRALYRRAGFTFIDGVGVAIVRNGKLSRVGAIRSDGRLDGNDEIDLDGLIQRLLTIHGQQRDSLDSLEARIDALKRKCATGYACGSSCISPAKECRSEGGSTSKQRAQRLEEIAQGGKAGRGIGQLRGEAAAAKAAEIRGARSERAAQLRQQRAQQRKGGGTSSATPDSFTANEAIALQVLANGKLKSDRARVAEMVRLGVSPDTDMLQLVSTAREKLGGPDWWKDEGGWKNKLKRFAEAAANPDNSAMEPVGGGPSGKLAPAQSGGGKPGGIADTMRQALNAMKAADARQMGMVAEQLFESEWILERRSRYRGMSKDQAREVFKAEFAKQLQQADQARRAAGPSDAARRAAEAGSVAGAMRSLIEDMKASDERLQELTEQTIDLRVQAEEFNEGGDESSLGGSTSRRQLGGRRRKGRGSRRDSADHWFDYLVARLDAAKRKCTTGYGCGSTCINVKKECRSEGGAGAASKERIQRLEQLSRGEIKPRGLGVPKPAEAAAMATELQGRRTSRAQALRGERQAARAAKEAEAAKAAEKAQQEAAAKKATTGRGKPRKGTPRAEAETVEGSGDYEFARKSAIGNAGEDLVNSARHKRNAFRTIEEAEASGEVEKLLTRDNLMKNFPIDLLDGISPHNVLSRMEAHLSLKAFPSLSAKEVDSYVRAAERRRESGSATRAGKPIEEVDAKTVRKQYFDAFQTVRQFVEDNRDMEPGLLRRQLASKLTELIANYRGEEGTGYYRTYRDPFNPAANALIDMQRRLVKTGTSSVYGQMNAFAKALNEAGKLNPDDARGTLELALEPARRIIEGESLAKAFGQENTSGKWRFNPGVRYVGDVKREGGRQVGGTPQAATDEIINGLGFRGLQYGNSVTDDERAHHVQKAAEALVDLADAIGLPDQAIGLNGTLGLAIGARGRGGAAAHYEPDLKVINLTRKNGVGSLSHEWGHALDNYVSGGTTFLSEYRGIKATRESIQAMSALQSAWSSSGFLRQVQTTLREIKRAGGQLSEKYWLDDKELLARSFEAHVSLKLAKAGRSNTYLTRELHEGGMRKGEDRIRFGDGLWPSREQAEAMEPFFDALIAQLGKEHFPGAVRRDSRDARIRRFVRMLERA